MSKYLNTKPGSLESAVLEAVSPAQQAAIAIAKKEKGEKPKNEEKVECPKCKGEGCDHCDNKGYHMAEGSKEEYEKFFKSALKKFGVDSPADFKSDEEKKKFFDYVDKNYKGENEEVEIEEGYGKVKSGHYDVKVTVKDREVAAVKNFIQNSRAYNNGEIEDVDSDAVDGGGMKFKGTGDIYIQGDGAGDLGVELLKKFGSKIKVVGESVELDEGYSPKEIKMAIGIASDKRYAGGNMSGAVKAIDKIKKGLSDHPQVAAVLKRQNESLAQLAAKHISDMWSESAKKKEDVNINIDDEEDEDEDEKENGKKTMTGKPMSKVEVSPKDKEED